MLVDYKKPIKFLQLNAARRMTTHDCLMNWLNNVHDLYVVCVQEPLITKKGLSKVPYDYVAYWKEAENGKHSRAAIIAPKCMHGYMITQHSDRDCVVVRFACINMSIVSLYMDLHKPVEVSMTGVTQEVQMGSKIIICADTNAHHYLWGATGKKKTRIKLYARGEQIVECMDEYDMCICNITPHKHTYIGDTGHSTHIDATFCSSNVHEKIMGWEVLNEQYDSDHRAIHFTLNTVHNVTDDSAARDRPNPWKRPSPAMLKRLHACLPKMIKYKRRVGSEGDINVFVQRHTQEVQEAIRKISGSTTKHRNVWYWWTDEVRDAHALMKKARRRAGRFKHTALKEEYNYCRRRFREKVREAKIHSWQVFVSNIDDPWKGLMGILSRLKVNKAQDRTLCHAQGTYAKDLSATLQLLGRQFYPEPSAYTVAQKEIEDTVQQRLEQVEENEAVTVCEFRKALGEMSKATASGTDGITNSILHALARQGGYEKMYIELFNACLKLGVFPHAWKCAKIVLIPKPSSLTDSVKALRPISLTSALSKLLERIVLARILHYIEMSGNLSLSQHAYRKGGSTTTALYEAAKFTQDAIKDRQVCVIVFLDISGAFDRTWHGGILNRLLQYGVPGYLVRWVRSFLADRKAHFSAAGEEHVVDLKQGCPQGGVLSPVLWNVLFNDMLVLKTRSSQDFHLKIVGYADDAAVLCRAGSVKNASVILTRHLIRIKQWAEENRVQFNIGKLNVLTVNRNFKKSPAEVYYDSKLIREVTQYKYLGVIFDNRFSWRPHVNNVLEKLAGVTRMLRGAVRETWGVRMSIMRMIFKSVFCPILLYGVAIWGWRMMGVTQCARFDKVMRKFCIMSTRCFKTTSNEALFKLMKTESFSTLAQQEVLRVALLQLNLASDEKDYIFSRNSAAERHSSHPMSMDHFFYICKQELSRETQNTMYENLLYHYQVHPSEWFMTRTYVKSKTEAMWEGARREGWVIFTDASVSSYRAGWAYIVYHHGFCINTRYASLSRCSIFTAEAQAILHAVQYCMTISGLGKQEVVEIRSDSQAVIKALQTIIIVDPMLRQVKEALSQASKQGVNVILRWVPSHTGNEGNDTADKCAKNAVDSCICSEALWVKRDLKMCIKRKNNEVVRNKWEMVQATHF